jgi:predicted enzyme related to lactoylglutathione lyase
MEVPGAPAWFQVVTRDYEVTLDFYRKVFGWTVRTESDTAEFRYSSMVEGDTALAGVHDVTDFLPPDVPSRWEVCFQCTDTDATLERVGELGGSVVSPGADSPYGRLGTAADPTGGAFTLVSRSS